MSGAKVLGTFVWRLSRAPTDGERRQLRLLLCAHHGYPDGVPLDEPSPPGLEQAHQRVSRAGAEIELAVELLDDGSLRVAGAPAGAPADADVYRSWGVDSERRRAAAALHSRGNEEGSVALLIAAHDLEKGRL
jgi:hypothetical protein